MRDRRPNQYEVLKDASRRDDGVEKPDRGPPEPAHEPEPQARARNVRDDSEAMHKWLSDDNQAVMRQREEDQRARTDEESKRDPQAGRPTSRPEAWSEQYGLEGKELSDGARAKLDRLQDGASRESGTDQGHNYDEPTRPGRVRGED